MARVSNPALGVMMAFPTEDLARAHWSKLEDNHRFVVYAVHIGAFSARPALIPAAWVVLPEALLQAPGVASKAA